MSLVDAPADWTHLVDAEDFGTGFMFQYQAHPQCLTEWALQCEFDIIPDTYKTKIYGSD